MPIDLNNLGSKKNLQVEQNKVNQQKQTQQASTEQSASKPASAKDSVQLTPQAQALTKMQKQVDSEPVINRQRVESLKKAIINGEYKIDTDRLAQKMTQFESELGRAIGG